MIHYRKKVDDLIRSINIIRSKNGHLFSVEDNDLLDQCSLKLEEIKQEIAGNKTTKAKVLEKLVNVVKLLDVFFGLDNIIGKYFNP